MGNSLTGLTPSTTYDALIKVGDNGPITSTLKTLSDGLGNDLPMEASTTAINFTNGLQQGGIAVPTASQVNAKQDTLVSGTNIKTVNSNSLLGSGNVIIDKTSVGLGNVANIDTTNASNITSGTLADARLSSAVTTQGNTFNTANKLVQLDASAKLPAVDGSQLTNLPIPTPPNGLLKIASAISTTLQTVTDYLGNLGVLQLSSRRVGILSDSGVTTQTSSVIQATTTNANLVIAPNGTGALVASIPDGTATGGNARGNNAVDLQMARANANQVAGGSQTFLGGGQENFISTTVSRSAIVNGYQNITNSGFTFIGSGAYNTVGLNTVSGYSAIVSGSSNKINYGTNSFIGSGDGNIISAAGGGGIVICGGSTNTASSSYSTISGGQSNTASTNTHATVVGGSTNTSSGQYSVSGGFSNTASGGQSSVALGYANTASGLNSIAIGYQNNAQSNYSIALGYNSLAYLNAQFVHSSGQFTTRGDCQQANFIARKSDTLTTGGTTVLSLDGTGVTNLIIPNGNNRMWNVQIDTIAVVTTITGTATGVTVGDAYRETKQLLFKRVGGTSSIVGTVDTTAIKNDTSMATASLGVTAGASQEMALTFTAPTFSGGGSLTCRVVSKVQLVEVAY